jgi:Kef-type K+ transport system membrane component KefB
VDDDDADDARRGWLKSGRWGNRLVVAGTAVLLAGLLAVGVPGLLRVGSHTSGVSPVVRFLLALAVIALVCHLLGELFTRLRQPRVVGEIVGGLVLGPSVLGPLWPAGERWLFAPDMVTPLNLVAQLGLVTFMFLLGRDLVSSRIGARARTIWAVTAGSTVAPFVGGMLIAVFARPLIQGPAAHPAAVVLYFGLAVSITALPVLARILIDLKMDDSAVGRIALGSAAIGDASAWAVLALILAVTGIGGGAGVLTTVGLGVALLVLTQVFVRPLLAAIVRRAERDGRHEAMVLPILVAGAVAYAGFTQLIGLDAVIGAFLFGTAAPTGSAVVDRTTQQLAGFAVNVLLPVFFAGVGLAVHPQLLAGGAAHWLLAVGVLLVASLTKFGGASGAGRLAGLPRRDALRVGALVNCRGVTELVIAGVGLQYHLINTFGFTILVLVALVTTVMSGPLLRLLGRVDRIAEEPAFLPH